MLFFGHSRVAGVGIDFAGQFAAMSAMFQLFVCCATTIHRANFHAHKSGPKYFAGNGVASSALNIEFGACCAINSAYTDIACHRLLFLQ
jgi:hypothetical protein